MLGSSRSTYINQHKFKDLKVYNLSVSSMYVEEYMEYIEYAKKRNGEPFKYIFLGLDFFAANQFRAKITNEQAEFYINQANSYLYRLKTLASFDTLDLSVPVLKSSLQDKPTFVDHRYYNRKNVAYPFPVTDELRKMRIETIVVEFFKKDEPYKYDPNIKKILNEIIKANPDTKFIVYTTPVTASRLMIQLENEDYKLGFTKWLRDLVETFGEVHHYMRINEGTLQLENFSDSHHFIPSFGNKIVNEIWNERGKEPELGVVLSKKNIDREIMKLESDIREHKDIAYSFLKPLYTELPLYRASFKNDSRPLTINSSDWTSQLDPLKMLGAKGTFNIVKENDALLITPFQAGKASALQIGYDLSELSQGEKAEVLTFIVSIKGKTASPGAVQLFIQDQVDGNWERAAYNTLPDEQHYRSFKVTKKIRPGTEKILIGIRWTNITHQQEWLKIQKGEIY
ncbi:hypothetical protein JCM21738_789 [Mesobacillus boroniphilus JCM 21738]|uniref:Uncharacterized protein n=2 Tax=Mesobacillus boroniphilus TaxID=308892 RepID=W4RIZ2_9BACI|nr:hypothetical protein JCM21738_789 [Mesobacillus boroniphilus JCM 21738]